MMANVRRIVSSPDISHQHKNFLSLHLHLKSRHAQFTHSTALPRLQIKIEQMQRAKHTPVLHKACGERAAAMRAAIVERIKRTRAIEKGDLVRPDLEYLAELRRDFADRGDALELFFILHTRRIMPKPYRQLKDGLQALPKSGCTGKMPLANPKSDESQQEPKLPSRLWRLRQLGEGARSCH